MKILKLADDFTICKVNNIHDIDFTIPFTFFTKTDEELSLVCPTKTKPSNTDVFESGWTGFRIEGILDFSLVGIISHIAQLLASNYISIFVVSTYNTDYFFIKQSQANQAIDVLIKGGYEING